MVTQGGDSGNDKWWQQQKQHQRGSWEIGCSSAHRDRVLAWHAPSPGLHPQHCAEIQGHAQVCASLK